jgi:O-antigen/teichoic acid export membrane protein
VRSLKSNFLYQLLVSLLYTAAPLIVFPYVSRVLGPANIGRINFIDYAVQFFIVLSSFGLPFYGVREVAKARNDRERLAKVTSELLVIRAIITLVSVALFTLFILFRPEQFREKELVLIAIVNIATNAVAMEWIIHGLEDFSFLAKRSFLVKLVSLAAVFIFVQQSSDYIVYYFLLMAGNLLLLAMDMGYVLRQKIFYSGKLQLKQHLRPLSLFFLTTVTLSIYTFFDTVILGLVTSSALAVGFYTTSVKVIRLSHNFISDLGGVLLPRVSFLIDEGKHEEIRRIINKSLAYVLTITLPLCIFFFLAADEIIYVLAGEQFSGAVSVLKILSPLPVIIGISNIFFIQVLLPYGKEKILLTGVLIGCAVSIASNFLLSPVYAEDGAAASCLIAELCVTVYLGIFAARQVRFELSSRMFRGILLCCLVFYPMVIICRAFIDARLLLLMAEAMLCFGLYGILQWKVFKNETVEDMMAFIGSKLRGKTNIP